MEPTGITSETLNLIAVSPQIFPLHPFWEPRHRLTSYWFAPAPETWTPPADLPAFLEAGEPPVVISLGAMALSGEDALEGVQIALEAVKQAEVCAIIQGWDEAMKQLNLPPERLPRRLDSARLALTARQRTGSSRRLWHNCLRLPRRVSHAGHPAHH
jgi:UDP:flavonoid glycosyltransferase YjiC (YdhE family)